MTAKDPDTTVRVDTADLIVSMHMIAQALSSTDASASAKIREAENRLSKLHLMVAHSYPIVKAQQGAERMLDGFGKPKKRAIDDLASEFECELGSTANTHHI
jgi:hypothetical protein